MWRQLLPRFVKFSVRLHNPCSGDDVFSLLPFVADAGGFCRRPMTTVKAEGTCEFTMGHPRMGRALPVFLLACLVSVSAQPVALAQAAWVEDGWLSNNIGLDRVMLGDEIGCYGMPHLSWYNDPGAVAASCRRYIEDRLPASKWGDAPISTFTPSGLTMAQHTTVQGQGFAVHGDQTGLSVSAWHDADDEPHDVWDWFNLGRRGGSLELGIADVDTVRDAVEAGGLVNMYWVGRINEATVRHDRDVVAMLTSAENVWLTTWGEAWSTWAVKRCFEFEHDYVDGNNTSVLRFRPLLTEQCTAVQDGMVWNLPVTWMLDVEGEAVARVLGPDGELPNIEGEQNTMEGWWQDEHGTVLLSVQNNRTVEIHLNASGIDHDILGQSAFWNNHSAAVTVAGHATTDLFRWSKRFIDDPSLRFTWLVEPKPAEGDGVWMTYAVVGITLVTFVGMLGVLAREGVGPLAGRWPTKVDPLEIRSTSPADGRRLHGEDE